MVATAVVAIDAIRYRKESCSRWLVKRQRLKSFKKLKRWQRC